MTVLGLLPPRTPRSPPKRRKKHLRVTSGRFRNIFKLHSTLIIKDHVVVESESWLPMTEVSRKEPEGDFWALARCLRTSSSNSATVVCPFGR